MYQDLPIDVVRPADDNLRRRVGDVSDIVATIPTHGILEPLVVAPQDDGTYVIVAGHRRYAAATEAGLSILPCVVRPMTDEERTLAALVENGSRQDLHPSEEATGISRLCQAGWTLTRLAEAIGRSRRHVSGRLALLELPASVRKRVDKGTLSIADAAELLKAKDYPEAFKQLCAAAVAGELGDVRWAVTHPPRPAGRGAGAEAAKGRSGPARLRPVRPHRQPGSGQIRLRATRHRGAARQRRLLRRGDPQAVAAPRRRQRRPAPAGGARPCLRPGRGAHDRLLRALGRGRGHRPLPLPDRRRLHAVEFEEAEPHRAADALQADADRRREWVERRLVAQATAEEHSAGGDADPAVIGAFPTGDVDQSDAHDVEANQA